MDRFSHGVPHLGAAIRTFIDEVYLRHAPVRFDVAHIHGQQSNTAGANYRCRLDFVMTDIGWHIGSPAKRPMNINPVSTLAADVAFPSSTLSNVHRTDRVCCYVWQSRNITAKSVVAAAIWRDSGVVVS